jgi:hypothetical protein
VSPSPSPRPLSPVVVVVPELLALEVEPVDEASDTEVMTGAAVNGDVSAAGA